MRLKNMKLISSIALIAALTACARPDVTQFAITMPAIEPVRATRATVEVLEVSLPLYAQGQEIAFTDTTGAIRTDATALWADEPSRAISIALAQALSSGTGATVAVEPWPLDDRAGAKLDVRVKTLVASAQGTLTMSGQFFLVFDSDRPAISDWFDINVPLRGTTGLDISAATGTAVAELAQIVGIRLTKRIKSG